MALRFKIEGLKRYESQIRAGLAASSAEGNPIKDAFKQWAFQYRTFLFRRFITNSRGGGDWLPLNPSTIRRRRKGSGKAVRDLNGRFSANGQAAIMVDTGIMKNVLDPRIDGVTPGRLEELIKNGIKVGFGGPQRHPGSQYTIGQIAWLQHHGNGGNLPPRPILVAPDAATKSAMVASMQAAIRKLGR